MGGLLIQTRSPLQPRRDGPLWFRDRPRRAHVFRRPGSRLGGFPCAACLSPRWCSFCGTGEQHEGHNCRCPQCGRVSGANIGSPCLSSSAGTIGSVAVELQRWRRQCLRPAVALRQGGLRPGLHPRRRPSSSTQRLCVLVNLRMSKVAPSARSDRTSRYGCCAGCLSLVLALRTGGECQVRGLGASHSHLYCPPRIFALVVDQRENVCIATFVAGHGTLSFCRTAPCSHEPVDVVHMSAHMASMPLSWPRSWPCSHQVGPKCGM